MLGLVQLVPKPVTTTHPVPRLWLVFFSNDRGAWWARLMRPGFRHVCAAAWFAGQDRWVYFNPTRGGTVIEVATDAEFGPRFQQLIQDSSAILRVRSAYARGHAPAAFFCVGAIKALLGIRSCALLPWGLYRHLRAAGAEIVERPAAEDESFGLTDTPSAAGPGRGPRHHEGAEASGPARRGGQNPGDAGPIAAGNAAA